MSPAGNITCSNFCGLHIEIQTSVVVTATLEGVMWRSRHRLTAESTYLTILLCGVFKYLRM